MKRLSFLLIGIFTAMACSAQISQNVSLVGHWADSTINVFLNNQYNECWAFEQGGVEYAVVGSTEGYHFIDLSDPANPVEVDVVLGEINEAIHRDMHDHNGYMFMVCDEGDSHLKIADLSYLPDSVHVVYDSDDLIRTCHNIFIDSTSGLMYTFFARDTNGNTLPTVSVFEFDPNNNSMTQVGGWDAGSPFLIAHDGYVVDDTAYINLSGDGFLMVDFNDVQNPATIGQLPLYPSLTYNHSGWLDPVRKLYMMADEWQGTPINIVDVADPTNLSIVNSFMPGTSADIIPHNLMVNGRFMFLSAYTDGLRVFDLLDPQNPILTGFYDTYSGSDSDIYEGAWGVYSLLPSGLILLSDQRTGFYIFDVSLALAREDEQLVQAEVWPVPSANQVRLDWSPEDIQPTAFRMRDLSGRTLEERVLEPFGDSELKVELGELPAGIYLLELEGMDGKRIVERVVRE